jgi:hypothetical protein
MTLKIQRLKNFGGTRCIHSHPEDGGSKVVRNVGILPHHYTASQARRRRLEISVGTNVYKIENSKTHTSGPLDCLQLSVRQFSFIVDVNYSVL